MGGFCCHILLTRVEPFTTWTARFLTRVGPPQHFTSRSGLPSPPQPFMRWSSWKQWPKIMKFKRPWVWPRKRWGHYKIVALQKARMRTHQHSLTESAIQQKLTETHMRSACLRTTPPAQPHRKPTASSGTSPGQPHRKPA